MKWIKPRQNHVNIFSKTSPRALFTIVFVIVIKIKSEMQQLPAIIAKCPVNRGDSNFSSINSNSVVHYPPRSKNFLLKSSQCSASRRKAIIFANFCLFLSFFSLSNKWKRPLAVDGHPVGADVGQRSRGGPAPRIGRPLNRCGHFRLAAAAGGQLCEYLWVANARRFFFLATSSSVWWWSEIVSPGIIGPALGGYLE